MAEKDYSVKYPRNRIMRGFLRLLGRVVFNLLARTAITGRENIPKEGPLLMVGNHVAVMEVALMVVYSPRQVEVVGAGDIPIEPSFAPIVRSFGYIPIKRGSMDRGALTKALGVLKQDGVVGVFPEGGIWDTQMKQARSGVAWLSYRANAPILPIGFGGMKGAVDAMAKFQFPRMTMNVGELIPPVTVEKGKSRMYSLELAANRIMARVEELIPNKDEMRHPLIIDERFDFEIVVHGLNGDQVTYPAELELRHAGALSKFFYRPILLDAFRRNLNLPVRVLEQLQTAPTPVQISRAIQAILDYLERDNPYFLTYRFGYEEGTAMEAGLRELQEVANWAAASNFTLTVRPIRRYCHPDYAEEIVEYSPGAAHKM